MKTLSCLLLMLVLSGCATKEPLVRTEYIYVEVPVVYQLERPSRPKFTNQSVPSYVKQLTTYTERLEVIIDEHNNKGTKTK